ncbi:MAG: nucleoside transporter C-terminal domain-containing protein, partial [Myxococcota bacterium]
LLQVGSLLGTKIALNEFLAYTEMLRIQDSLSPRSIVLATYALCGFACFSSVGVLVGSLSALVPERRIELSRIALRAMAAGALASSMTATIAGLLL